MKKAVPFLIASALVASTTMAATAAPLTPAQRTPRVPELAVEPVPYEMDSSNQAGWWHPVAEHRGSTYFVFNAPAEAENRHEVRVAKRSPSGEWTAGCLHDAGGACVTYGDDIGHNQPSIAIDGDGYIHAFVSMHNDPWRYYRSEEPESVTTVVDHAADLPDQEAGVTYPVTVTSPRGDVYLMARVNVPAQGHTGRLYKWSVEHHAWNREAVLTPGHSESGYVPYPDDLAVDHRGDVHILWEWARGSTSNLRYYGSYLVYQPRADRFVDAGGTEVTLPVEPDNSRPDTSDVMYEPREGVVQSARLTLVESTSHLAGIAYRYRPPGGSTFEVRWASWDGSQWVRSTVAAGAFDTYAAIATTHHRSTARVYYVQHPSCDPEQATTGTVYVAEQRVTPGSDGSSGEWSARRVGGPPGVERLAAITRRGGTDALYLAAPNLENPNREPSLSFATLPRSAAPPGRSTSDDTPIDSPETTSHDGRKNWAFGAPVEVSSSLGAASEGICAVDGNNWADYSRWMSSRTDPEPSFTIPFTEPIQVDEVRMYSGYQGGTTSIVDDFAVDLHVDGEWREIERVTGNQSNPAVVAVDDLARADQARLRVLNMEHPNHLARVYEVEVYSRVDAPPLTLALSSDPPFQLFAGETTELTVDLANRSLAHVGGTLEIMPPERWTVASSDLSYNLSPNETASVSFTVTSPTTAEPRSFDVTVRASEHDVAEDIEVAIRDGIIYNGDGAPFYVEIGSWSASGLVGHAGTATRYTQGGTGATATWTPELPEAGRYRVHVWSPSTSGTTAAAAYTVNHADGEARLVVDQLETGNAWHELGEWDFAQGTTGSVTLRSEASGHHRANAVRFERVAP